MIVKERISSGWQCTAQEQRPALCCISFPLTFMNGFMTKGWSWFYTYVPRQLVLPLGSTLDLTQIRIQSKSEWSSLHLARYQWPLLVPTTDWVYLEQPLRVVDWPQRSWKLRFILSLVSSCVYRAPLSQWQVGSQLQKAAVATSAPVEIFKGSSCS